MSLNIETQISYWLESAEYDLETAQDLFDKKRYSWCLFLGHLVLEKVLKAIYIQANQELPPKTHDLYALASKVNIELTEDQQDFLHKVTFFNIEARYPDYKASFYKVCTKEFTEEHFQKIKEYFQWLKSQLTS
jgi:HEPN domain-containing protein